MANVKTYNVASFILIFAALLAILSFLCGWISMSSVYNSSYASKGIFVEWTGYSILTGWLAEAMGAQKIIPLCILILGILALIVAFLPKVGMNIPAPKYSLVLLLVGFAILVLTLVFLFQTVTLNIDGTYVSFNAWQNIGISFWMALFSSIMILFVAALPALTKKV